MLLIQINNAIELLQNKKKKKFSAILSKVVWGGTRDLRVCYLLNQLCYRLLMVSQDFILHELSALSVHYFPTFSCTQLTYPRKVLDNNKKL